VSLPVPNLDDRRYQDLVDEAKRLIPTYCPEWTNHNLSDPGVALIELFAWMTEMVLFRLNQVPDAFYTRFLNLLGVEPFPPTAARAELTFWLAGEPATQVVVPAGTAVATEGSSGPTYVFSTLEDLVISQPSLLGALSSPNGEIFTDVSQELAYDRVAVPVFATDPLQAGDGLYLAFGSSLAGNVIELEIDAGIEGIGVDPSRPPLAWEVWADDAWIPCPVHEDTTGGLNRHGRVRLLMPPLHEPMTLGGHRAFWLRARLTEAAPDQPTYRASPQIRTLVVRSLGGAVAAEHSEVVGEEYLGTSNGQPGQSFTLRNAPVLVRRRAEACEVVLDGEAQTWTEVADFGQSSAEDRHVVWNSATGEVHFGPRIRYPDGTFRQHGAVPPAGATVRVSGYRFGGGAGGNVGAATLSALRTTIPYVDRVTNLAAATGGVDAETVDNAKLRGPQTVRTGQRAVTVGDFERLALEADATVARVRCLAPAAPTEPVRLLVVPKIERRPEQLELDDFALDDALVARVGEHLDERRVLGGTVEIGTPYYQGVTVAALLKSLPGRPEPLVRQRALDALYGFVHPLTGGPHGIGWPFDLDLNAATVGQLLGSVDGVERVDEVLFFEYDLRNQRRHGRGQEVVRLAPDSLFLSAAHRVVVR